MKLLVILKVESSRGSQHLCCPDERYESFVSLRSTPQTSERETLWSSSCEPHCLNAEQCSDSLMQDLLLMVDYPAGILEMCVKVYNAQTLPMGKDH